LIIKILGLDEHSVVAQGKHGIIYFNREHVRTIDYVPLEKLGYCPNLPFMEALISYSLQTSR